MFASICTALAGSNSTESDAVVTAADVEDALMHVRPVTSEGEVEALRTWERGASGVK